MRALRALVVPCAWGVWRIGARDRGCEPLGRHPQSSRTGAPPVSSQQQVGLSVSPWGVSAAGGDEYLGGCKEPQHRVVLGFCVEVPDLHGMPSRPFAVHRTRLGARVGERGAVRGSAPPLSIVAVAQLGLRSAGLERPGLEPGAAAHGLGDLDLGVGGVSLRGCGGLRLRFEDELRRLITRVPDGL